MKYNIKSFLPQGDVTQAWISRTYSRILKCQEGVETTEGEVKEAFVSELKVLQLALKACDISLDKAEQEYQTYRRLRTMKREAIQKAMKEAAAQF